MSKVKDALCIEYGEFDVSEDRSKYIGGSDIPVIMGLSTFKRRWDLLLEKAGLKEDTFTGNVFTEYGHVMEEKIRDYVNQFENTPFVPNRVINGDIRCHTDGFNGECVLEIKTTSHIFSSADAYKIYLCQLLKYMEENGVQKGKLCVYNRPEDLSYEFDPDRLQIFDISMKSYVNILDAVNREIDRFRVDLEILKENPLLTEQDFLRSSGSLITLSNKVVAFEKQIADMKLIENQLKDAKTALYNEMVKHNVKSWVTPNGTKITRVDGVPAGTKTVMEFDVKSFKAENEGLYGMYLRETEKESKGRSGYVRITV